jgi:ATP-dependent Clp protease ATP-binding subunit ClpC
MNGYSFTDRVRRVLQIAREEAARLGQDYVGTEHILLALIREGEGVAVAVLTNLSVDFDAIQQRIEHAVKKGNAATPAGPDLPYTSRAKNVLELAMSEARHLHSKYVETEHLLLGVLAEEKGIAAQALGDAGVTLQAARAETFRLLGTAVPYVERDTEDEVARRILAKASELVGALVAQPPPHAARVHEIGTELKALMDELRDLV